MLNKSNDAQQTVWLLCRSYYPNIGGIETSIFEMSKSLSKMGYTVVVFSEEPENREFIQRKEYGVVEYYKPRRNAFSRILIPLRIVYRRKEIDKKIRWLLEKYGTPFLVIARDPLMAMRYYKIIGKNITYIPPSVIAFDYENKNKKDLRSTIISRILMKYEQYFQEYCFNHFKKIIVFSENVRCQVLKRIHDKNACVEVIHPGCNAEIGFLESYGYGYNKVKLLFVGRIVEDKNLLMLIKAIENISRDDIILKIVGDGDQRDIVEKYVSDNHIDNVIFCGFQRETSRYYSEADYTIIPSKYESFGQAITESLYHGTPVIGFVTIIGKTLTAFDELIEDEKTGFLIRDFNEEALENVIIKAISFKQDKEKYIKMRIACAEYARDNFNWDVFVKRSIEVMTKGD